MGIPKHNFGVCRSEFHREKQILGSGLKILLDLGIGLINQLDDGLGLWIKSIFRIDFEVGCQEFHRNKMNGEFFKFIFIEFGPLISKSILESYGYRSGLVCRTII